MDVETAFLNGVVKEEIYMRFPKGLTEYLSTIPTGNTLRLKKALYGLKQGGSEWYAVLHTFLTNHGFSRSDADWCIYSKGTGSNRIIIGVYVDDIIIATRDLKQLNDIKTQLSTRFKMQDMGEIQWFLKVKITRDRNKRSITLDQSLFARHILSRFNMTDCKTSPTPIDASTKITELDSPSTPVEKAEMSSIPYNQAVGSLMYLMVGTRPDLAHAVGFVSRFLSNPGPKHWTVVKRILRYLKGTESSTLTLGNGSHEPTLSGYSDSDWAGDLHQRKSTGGYCFFVAGGVVSWKSKILRSTALPSCEAEFMALCSATSESVWLRLLLSDMGFEQKTPTTIYEDNQGAIALSKNTKNSTRVKHIGVQYHFIRERVETGEIQLEYIDTHEMTADIFTKPVGPTTFKYLRQKLAVSAADIDPLSLLEANITQVDRCLRGRVGKGHECAVSMHCGTPALGRRSAGTLGRTCDGLISSLDISRALPIVNTSV